MTLAELNTPFERKRIITYASDNMTAICKNKELQHIVGTIYKGRDKIKDSQTSCRLYCYFTEYQIGIDIQGIAYPEVKTVEDIEVAMQKQGFSTQQDLVAELDKRVTNGGFIANAYIKLAEYLAPERVSTYIQARSIYLEQRERKEAEQKARIEAEEKVLREKEKVQVEEQLSQAISIMLSNGVLENSICLSERSVINLIARKFEIIIPIKVQGWINNSLVSVAFKDGCPIRYSYKGNKSKTFCKYFDEVVAAVKKQEQIIA